MGVNIRELDGGKEYREHVFHFGNILVYRTIRPWLESDLMLYVTGFGNRIEKVLTKIHAFADKVIKEKKTIFDKWYENNMIVNDE